MDQNFPFHWWVKKIIYAYGITILERKNTLLMSQLEFQKQNVQLVFLSQGMFNHA